jgi:hypothetical protein
MENIVLPALIALIGTLSAVLIGYRQWRLQHRAEAQMRFLKARHDSYQQIWDLLVRFTHSMRNIRNSGDTVNSSALYSEILERLQEGAIYLDESDRELVLVYIKKLTRLDELVARLGKKEIADSLESFDDLTQMGTLSRTNDNVWLALILWNAELSVSLSFWLLGSEPAPRSANNIADKYVRHPLALLPFIWMMVVIGIIYTVIKKFKGREAARSLKLAFPDIFLDFFLDRELSSRLKQYLTTKRKVIRRFRAVLREP